VDGHLNVFVHVGFFVSHCVASAAPMAAAIRRMLPMKREPLVEDIQDYALNIVDTVREPLLILDATLRVRSANRAFYQTFQVSAEETVDRLIYELGNGQWGIPDLRRLLEDIVPIVPGPDCFDGNYIPALRRLGVTAVPQSVRP
jgi:PAS domain-containing protein